MYTIQGIETLGENIGRDKILSLVLLNRNNVTARHLDPAENKRYGTTSDQETLLLSTRSFSQVTNNETTGGIRLYSNLNSDPIWIGNIYFQDLESERCYKLHLEYLTNTGLILTNI